MFDLARGAFASATRAGDLCELLPEAFYRAAESARGGVAGRIEGLGSLIPDYAPLDFNLEHQGKDKDYLGGQKIPVYARRWFKDKEQVLLQEEVTEYPSTKMALSTFRHHAESLCQSSSAFTEPEWLMGGMLFTQQQGLNVIRHLQFIRGPRIYSVMYMGPAPDVRLEMLEAFGRRAREVAR